MRNLCRKSLLFYFLTVFCLLTVLPAGFAGAADHQPAGFDQAAENESLILYYNQTNGEVAVQNKISGFVWRSNPVDADKDQLAQGVNKIALAAQLLVGYVDKSMNEVTIGNVFSSIKQNGMKMEKINNGVKFIYRFPNEKLVVPVQYSLDGDSFKAEIVTSEIVEEGDNRVLNLSLLPFFGAAGATDDGYMVVPDGSGALIRFNNGKIKSAEYNMPVYGRDTSLKLLSYQYGSKEIKMPVFGVKNGEHAFLAVLSKGEADAAVQAVVSGMKTGYNNVNPKYRYHVSERLVLDGSNNATSFKVLSKTAPNRGGYEVRYFLLEGKQADYGGMAERYRQVLSREEGFTKKVVKDEYPLYVETFGGVKKKKYFLGIPFQSLEPLTTYKQAQTMLEDIKRHGINDIVLKYDGWTENGIRDKIPVKVSFESKLGGEKAFQSLVSYARDNQIGLFPSVDFINLYKNGNGIRDYSDSVKGVNLSTVQQYRFMLNILTPFWDNRWSLLKPPLVESVSNKFYESYRKLHIPAIALDSIGSMSYSDYAKDGLYRSDVTPIWKRTIGTLQSQVGSVLVDNANAYAFSSVNHIMNAPVESDRQDMTDESIPFYQMVVHGFVPYSVPLVNLADDPEEMVLKAAETGSSLSYAWIAGEDVTVLRQTPLDNLYSANYRPWLDTVEKDYKKLKEALSPLADKRITKHRQISTGLVETTFENGTKMIVNYNRESKSVNGKIVGARDFLVVRE